MGARVIFGGGKPPKSASLMGNDEQHETYKLEQKERFYASRRRGGGEEEEEEEEKTRARKRITKSIKRGAFTGLTLKGGVNVFAVLSRYLRGKTTREQLKAREAFEDAVKFSAFVGSFAGAYVTSDEVLAWKFGAEKTKRYRAFVSGVVASPSFLLAGAKPNYSLASYLSLKALVLMSRVGAKSENGRVRSLFRVTNWEHADVAVVTGSAVVILGCFILKPEAVRGAYGAFLDRHCGKTKRQVEALRELCFLPENDPEGKGEEMFREYCERTAIVLNKTGSLSAAKKDEMLRAIQRGGGGVKLPYSRDAVYRKFFMNDANPIEHFLAFVKDSWGTSFISHVPIYVFPAILLHREKLLKDPKLLGKLFAGIARSSLFLTVYCALAWQGPDVLGRLTKKVTPTTLVCGVPLAGAATFIEKKSRRGELATYCLDKSLESVVISMLSWGYIPKSWKDKRLDVLLFAFAAGTICMCYDRKRESFRSNYLNVFDFILGNRGHSRHKIRHVGSYEILFQPPSVVDLDALLLDNNTNTNDASFADNKKSAVKSRLSEGKGLAN